MGNKDSKGNPMPPQPPPPPSVPSTPDQDEGRKRAESSSSAKSKISSTLSSIKQSFTNKATKPTVENALPPKPAVTSVQPPRPMVTSMIPPPPPPPLLVQPKPLQWSPMIGSAKSSSSKTPSPALSKTPSPGLPKPPGVADIEIQNACHGIKKTMKLTEPGSERETRILQCFNDIVTSARLAAPLEGNVLDDLLVCLNVIRMQDPALASHIANIAAEAKTLVEEKIKGDGDKGPAMLVRQKSMNSVLNPKGGHESKKFEKLEQKTSRQSSLVSLMDSSADNHSTTRLGSFTGGSSSSSSSSSTNNTGGGNSPNHNQSYSERLMNQPSTTPTKNGSSQPAVDANFSQHSQGSDEFGFYDLSAHDRSLNGQKGLEAAVLSTASPRQPRKICYDASQLAAATSQVPAKVDIKMGKPFLKSEANSKGIADHAALWQ